MSWSLKIDQEDLWSSLDTASLETVQGKEYYRSLYENIVPEYSAKDFLEASDLYDVKERRWSGIPAKLKSLDKLRKATRGIMEGILLGLASEDQRACRQVVDAHKTPFLHYLQGGTADGEPRQSSVDLVIKATGPSFETPFRGEVGYSNVTTCVKFVSEDLRRKHFIKIDPKEQDYLKDLAVHVREMRIYQPNRQFVRFLLISPTSFRFYHFDRAGCQLSEGFDLHEDAELLVSLVLGLSAKDEAVLGLDTSIKWEVKNGRKVSGTIETHDLDGTPVVYDMASLVPYHTNARLCGRGSNCWKVKDRQTGKILSLKDAWMRPNTSPEWEALERAKGVAGVIQVVSYEKEHANLSEFRAMRPLYQIDSQPTKGYSTVQGVQERTVTKLYGKTIGHFTSEVQLIRGLRDCVAALATLALEKGMLHRDISPHNILFGTEPGETLVVIDLDYSITIESLRNGGNRFPVGTRPYQSIQVLYNIQYDEGLRHDHADDLESLFWVSMDLVGGRHLGRAGEPKFAPSQGSECPHFVNGLRNMLNADDAICNKEDFLESDSDNHHELNFKKRYFDEKLWSAATQELMNSFYQFIRDIVKRKAVCLYRPEKSETLSEELYESAEEHFNTVLGFFDKALKELEAPEKAKASKSSTGGQITKDNTKAPQGKRARGQQDDAAPPAKRSRTAPKQASQQVPRTSQRRSTRAPTSQRVEQKKVTSLPAKATRSRTLQEKEDAAPVAQRTRARTQPTATRSQGTTKARK